MGGVRRGGEEDTKRGGEMAGGLGEEGRRGRVDSEREGEEREGRGRGEERRGRASDVGEEGGRWYNLSVQVSG